MRSMLRTLFSGRACGALTLLSAVPLLAQPSATLSAGDIEEAIQWGITGGAHPYLVHTPPTRVAAGQPPRVASGVMAVVYTPLVRVALTAKAAHAAGRNFTSSDVPRQLLEPIVWVAFRWYCCVDAEHGRDLASWNPFVLPADYKIAVLPDEDDVSPLRLAHANPPLWIRQGPAILEPFGGLPYRDLVLVAGYPMSVLTNRAAFVIYREYPSKRVPGGKDIGLIPGQMNAEDFARWR